MPTYSGRTPVMKLAATRRSAMGREASRFQNKVRRLAASALGKLAGLVPATEAVAILTSRLRDSHPQVRQYAAKALGAFGTVAESALPDLRDLYRHPDEKDYGRPGWNYTRPSKPPMAPWCNPRANG